MNLVAYHVKQYVVPYFNKYSKIIWSKEVTIHRKANKIRIYKIE